MPAYSYRAADKAGAARKGVIEASSPAAARALLRDQALLPLSVEAASERKGITLSGFRRNRVSPKALATITRQIATLVGSD
ncbi:MAG: type II secretion system protein GspF, partial [Sphingomonadales bacterium]